MNISKVITTCIVLLAFVSCTDTNGWEEGTRTPSLKASFIYFPQSQIELGGTNNLSRTVQLQAVETPWRITNPASDWLEVSPMEGSGDATVTFKAKENPTSDNIRTAVLSLESTDADYSFSRVLTVNQGKANSVLNPSEQSFELTREAQTKTVSITANTDWKASCSVDWIHLTKVSDTSLEIKVDENNGTTDRQTNINITGSTSSSITILQHGYKFDDLISELVFEPISSTKILNITTDGAWTATSKESWIHISPKSGNGSKKLSISVDDNESTETRMGTISVTVGAVIKYVAVQQKGVYLTINTSSGSEIPVIGGTRTVTFSTSHDWTINCKNPSWVSIDKTSGSAGVNTITLTFSKNPQGTSRTDTTFIKSKNKNIQNLTIITVQTGNNYSNGHEWVDLGLPSKTLWATCNIGANSPEEYGDYFAWGETEPKDIYDWSTYKWMNKGQSSVWQINKYTYEDSMVGYGCWYNGDTFIGDGKMTLEPEDDAATANWGSTWCMPSIDQLEELFRPSNTSCEWTTVNGVYGLTITSKENGNSIFMPAAGYRSKDTSYNVGTAGHYTARSLSEFATPGVYWNTFNSKNITYDGRYFTNRDVGCPVRPVLLQEKDPFIVSSEIIDGHEYVDLDLPSGTLWATVNLGASSPEESGCYYAWGDTIGYTQEYDDKCNWENYVLCDKSQYLLKKYCDTPTYGKVDNLMELEPVDDAATHLWGEKWQIPSYEQMEELFTKCKYEWTHLTGIDGSYIYGYKMRSKSNNNYIFLPHNNHSYYGGYGSRTLGSALYPGSPFNVFFWGISENKLSQYGWGDRYRRTGIRPVVKKK